MADTGPWEVTVWIDSTDSFPAHYDFSGMSKDRLNSAMTKALNKSGITNVLGTSMPANIKKFSIRKAR